MPTRRIPRAAHQASAPSVAPPGPADTEPGGDRDSSGRTLRRGLQLLDAVLASDREGLRVVDLCRIAQLERATVHRLLATLLDTGHVAQRGRFRYVAGPRLAAMALHDATPNMAARLRPVLEQVSAACGDAAFAIVREGAASRCIARHVGTHPIQILVIQVGTLQPLGVGAAGLALLSALPDEQMKAAIAANAPNLARYGGMTPERMALLVQATRQRGWSVIGNHATDGVLAVGMAVRNAAGEPSAAISVASTLERMPRERQQLIARLMRDALAALLPDGL
ncbi:IclR family transcriptional regulator [Variovorax sp. SG517]|uniref:IclR family transcriptional regulator n=1 Tax=Variovorax sp. SG517 TaxID=2587117 RepID=UPI00159E32C5|nr:IclR family transcriptional regulator C-terminal domain-containing protein [Variovorax sp. SG517]